MTDTEQRVMESTCDDLYALERMKLCLELFGVAYRKVLADGFEKYGIREFTDRHGYSWRLQPSGGVKRVRVH